MEIKGTQTGVDLPLASECENLGLGTLLISKCEKAELELELTWLPARYPTIVYRVPQAGQTLLSAFSALGWEYLS